MSSKNLLEGAESVKPPCSVSLASSVALRHRLPYHHDLLLRPRGEVGRFLVLPALLLAITSMVVLVPRLIMLVISGRTGRSCASLVIIHRHIVVNVGEDLSACVVGLQCDVLLEALPPEPFTKHPDDHLLETWGTIMRVCWK